MSSNARGERRGESVSSPLDRTAMPPLMEPECAGGPTHEDLIGRAGRWLKNSRRCRSVLLEPSYGSPSEVPDAIGWLGSGGGTAPGSSVLVECKTSRADFLADQGKSSRKPGAGLGRERWYMTPPDLLDPGELPEGWGLLEVRGSGQSSRCYKVRTAHARDAREVDLQREVALLSAVLAAVQHPEGDDLFHGARHAAANLGRAHGEWARSQKSSYLGRLRAERELGRALAGALRWTLGRLDEREEEHATGGACGTNHDREAYDERKRRRAEEALAQFRSPSRSPVR